MADLSPDTSIYQHAGQQLDIGSVANLIRTGRELQTQSAVTEALRANPKDPQAALQSVLANPKAFPGFHTVTDATQASQAQYQLNSGYVRDTVDGLTSLITKPNATVKDFTPIAAGLSYAGVPPALIQGVINSANKDGYIDQRALKNLYNWYSQNKGLATVPTIDPATHQPVQVPAGQVIQGSGSDTSNPPPRAPGAAPGQAGGIGSYPTAAPPYQAGTFAEANKAQETLQHARAQEIPQQRQMLSSLLDLSPDAASGPGSAWQMNWSKLMTQVGMPQYANLTPKQVAASENFKKIAERIVNQMATSGGHITNDFLHNAYGSNPSLEMSRQGREGVITWLQGIVDSQNLVGKKWGEWLSTHPGQEGQFYNWASGRVPGGINMSSFDMRVFQFERMNEQQQDEFLASMKSKGEREEFLTHHRDYDRQGWLEDARQ